MTFAELQHDLADIIEWHNKSPQARSYPQPFDSAIIQLARRISSMFKPCPHCALLPSPTCGACAGSGVLPRYPDPCAHILGPVSLAQFLFGDWNRWLADKVTRIGLDAGMDD